jgi:hypothetical protein
MAAPGAAAAVPVGFAPSRPDSERKRFPYCAAQCRPDGARAPQVIIVLIWKNVFLTLFFVYICQQHQQLLS